MRYANIEHKGTDGGEKVNFKGKYSRYEGFCRNFALIAKEYLAICTDDEMLQKLLTVQDCFDARKLILTGNGIGFAAARSLYGLFTHGNDIMFGVELMTYNKFNYYAEPAKLGAGEPNTPLVLFFTEKLEGREYETSLQTARRLGADIIVVAAGTGSPENKICGLGLDSSEPDYAPRAYLGMLCAGLGLALRIKNVRGCCSKYEVRSIIASLSNYFENVQAYMPAIRCSAETFAEECRGKSLFEYIADWDRGGCAEFLGILGSRLLGAQYDLSDSETWCHIDVWELERQEICTVLVSDTAQPSFSRVVETANTVRLLQRPCLLISDADPGCGLSAALPEAGEELPWMSIFGNFMPGIIYLGCMEAGV